MHFLSVLGVFCVLFHVSGTQRMEWNGRSTAVIPAVCQSTHFPCRDTNWPNFCSAGLTLLGQPFSIFECHFQQSVTQTGSGSHCGFSHFYSWMGIFREDKWPTGVNINCVIVRSEFVQMKYMVADIGNRVFWEHNCFFFLCFSWWLFALLLFARARQETPDVSAHTPLWLKKNKSKSEMGNVCTVCQRIPEMEEVK